MLFEQKRNPFEVVKANDLSDVEIAEYFVDFPGGASLVERIKPLSTMPMIVFGGKGSGKTHLLRYLSHVLVPKRFPQQSQLTAISKAGFLGMYFRCGSLNSDRFEGKAQTDEVWASIFCFYMELWLAQLALSAVLDVCEDRSAFNSQTFLGGLSKLFDEPLTTPPASVEEFLQLLVSMQKQLDSAVNNAALTRKLDVRITASRGKLSFGLPRLLMATIPGMANTLFVYLIDEFESLSEKQQSYLNTLVRERETPCTFKIGVRLYGLKTKSTLSGDELIREHSEFEPLRLDEEFRARPLRDQLKFAASIVKRRLANSGADPDSPTYHSNFEDWFEGDQDIDQVIAAALPASLSAWERPYFKKLLSQLREFQPYLRGDLPDEESHRRLVEMLSFPSNPLIERVNVFLMYRAWSRGKNILDAAQTIHKAIGAPEPELRLREQTRVLKHFRADILAQLLMDIRQPQRYVGFKTFVQMSAGLPRALLTLLKNIYKWSSFLGEQPFHQGKISLKAQTEGVAESSEWFFNEARSPGRDGVVVRAAVTRLAELLREARYSDKPSECSLCTFSAELGSCSDTARTAIETSEQWSMLVLVPGGQSDRNTGRVDAKYQLHPMIAPRFDLPIARRGAIALSSAEIDLIFGSQDQDAFRKMQTRRLRVMNAPFGKAHARVSIRQRSLL
jgi:hypothetical protein